MKRTALIALVCAQPALGATCGSITDCGSCVQQSSLGLTGCYWCEIDQACHQVGSAVSACTPSAADDACISLSSVSHCTKRSLDACSASTAVAPQHIHIALAGPGGMRVAWKTNSMPASATVLFSKDFSQDAGSTVVAESSVQYLAAQGGHGYHHVATLSGLEPATLYQYRVVCDGVTSTERSFKTAPAGAADATFLVVGDMGFGDLGEGSETRARMEALKGSVDAVLHVGDVGYADDAFLHLKTKCTVEFCYEAIYDGYMAWMENITDKLPYMVAVGNHECECHSPACLASSELKESLRNFTAYNARWAMPSKESGGAANMWYSFDYGTVHFVVVNTETDFPGAAEGDTGSFIGLPSGHFRPDGEYLRWLEADLQAANSRRTERPFIVAYGHRPWITRDGQARTEDKVVQDAHAALFERYGVDLYLTGHVHSYHRLLPLGNNTATPIIVTGGAGCDEFASDRVRDGTWDQKGQNDLWDFRYFNTDKQVGLLQATATELTFTAISSTTGATLDTVKIPSRALVEQLVV